jgi:hypothetical protein
VFITWSGETSRRVAATLHAWLPLVIQSIQPFMSDEDTEKGSKWFDEVSAQLEDSNFGIVCLTPENIAAPWVHFEAGALSKSIAKSHVSPFLFGLSPSAVVGPLAQFQATTVERDDVLRLMRTINAELDEGLSESIINNAFDKFWPDLESSLTDLAVPLAATDSAPPPERSQREILEELLELVRAQSRQMTAERLPIPAGLNFAQPVSANLFDEPYSTTSLFGTPLAGGISPSANQWAQAQLVTDVRAMLGDAAELVTIHHRRLIVRMNRNATSAERRALRDMAAPRGLTVDVAIDPLDPQPDPAEDPEAT